MSNLNASIDNNAADLSAKADLASADFGEIKLDGNQVASYTYGSNANGRWQKWWDKDGNVIRVEQYKVISSPGAQTTYTWPVAFPDANYSVSAAGGWEGRFTSATNNTDTTTDLAHYLHNGTAAAGFPIQPIGVWIKS